MDSQVIHSLEQRTRYEPAEVEARIFAEWMECGYFHPEAVGDPAANYSVAIPPPNVTGALHMGHALNGSMQDALVRMQRMRGRNTLWLLGTDHASIAVHSVLEKELRAEGTSRAELGRDAFLERAWRWKQEYGSTIVEQFKRLGASCDYERERFTLDENYERAVNRVFKSLFDKGYIYRDNYMVNWDPGSRSVVSDLEVENHEVEDRLYSIDYPVEGAGGEAAAGGSADAGGSESSGADSAGAGHGEGAGGRVLTVATVRPETMLADTAVAVHPDDERYRDLIGGHCILPLVGRRLPIIADPHVDPKFGTGALKITPGHDPNDFEIGRAHGLEEISVIGADGRMREEAGERFAGLTAPEAAEAIVAALREEGRLRGEEPYLHSVPYSHRSGERIEPLISLQWFCRMEELARPAIEAVERDEVRITPAQWKRVYLDWMKNIRPWCISRQLWWGHRIPVWYCDACEETFVAEETPERCGACNGELRRDPDVLDTWFSSALWPFATLGWPDDTAELRAFYPTDFLTTARDILFLWVARMIVAGMEFTDRAPFRDVHVHSVIQARDGRRMSKSLGTGIDPLEEIDVHGADALRFGLLAMSSTQDVRYSDAKVEQGRDLANKVWNASRLILLNAGDVGERPAKAPAPQRPEDAWILSRLERTIEAVTAKLESYDFSHAATDLYHFFWSEYCDWYLEIVKPRLYEGEEDASRVLLWSLERILALAHPMIPFVTEEVWSHHPWRAGHLCIHEFPVAHPEEIDDRAEQETEAAIALTRRLRAWRDLVGAPASAVLRGRASGQDLPEFVARLSRFQIEGSASSGEAGPAPGREPVAVAAAGPDGAADGSEVAAAGPDGAAVATVGPVAVLESAEIDAELVRERIGKRKQELAGEVARAEGKLGNEGFVANAPPDVVEAEREKLAAYRAEMQSLEEG